MPATLERPSSALKDLTTSPVGRKLLTGTTGMLLMLFLTQHLAANLQVFSDDPQALNRYAHVLEGFGALLVVARSLLAALFVAHIIIGISIWRRKREARADGYAQYTSAGAPSRQTLSSRTMIVTGLLLLAFLILHLKTFTLGPGMDDGYVAMIDGETVRDLRGLVVERYQSLGYVVFYVLAMGLVGFHLKHGFWSAFQSLGWVTDRNRRVLYIAGVVFATLLAVGFMTIPLGVYVLY